MTLAESYITDEKGNVKAVILRYDVYKKIEEILLDLGLARAMEEARGDEELSLEDALRLVGTNK